MASQNACAGPGSAALRLRRLLESVPDAVIIADAHGRIVRVNAQTRRLFGFSEEELLGQPVELLIPERFRERHIRERRVYMASPDTRFMGAGGELYGRRRDGSEFPVENTVSPLETPDGRFAAVAIRDVSARRHAEQEARQRERETAALAAPSWAVASQVNRERALSEVLAQLVDLLHPEAAAILLGGDGRAPEAVAWSGNAAPELPVSSDGRGSAAMARVPGHGRSFSGSEERGGWELLPEPMDPPGAEYLPLVLEQRVLGTLYLQLPAGQVLSAAERRAVESLANHAAVVLERDRLALAQMQSEALAEADRLKTALLSMVSHDFCTPLASIKAGVTARLQERVAWDAAAQRELLREVNQAVDRLNRMVGNILSLSRLKADAWRPQREAIELAELIGAALDSFSPEEGRRVRPALAPAVAPFWLDPVQMVEVLHNLIENALHHSPPDAPVELSASWQRGELLLEVSDHGPGLPAGEEERVFEQFYRGAGRGPARRCT